MTPLQILNREIASYKAQALVSGTATAWTIPAIVEVLERIKMEIEDADGSAASNRRTSEA